MLPMKLTAEVPETVRRRYQVVKLDTLMPVPGLIVAASVETGLCMLKDSMDQTQEYNFGPDSIKIVVA